MCGRFGLHLPAKTIADFFLTLNEPQIPPRYNITPMQDILIVRDDEQEKGRIAVYHRWGLIPFWAKDEKIGAKLSNARSESLAEKPSFRAALRYRRCVIPVSGFYEWKREGGRKQPYYIQAAEGDLLAFAGLWETWTGPDGRLIFSATIVTTAANRQMEQVHHRMPAVLDRDQAALWLDASQNRVKELRPLLKPLPEGALVLRPVSTFVNRAGNEGPRCIEPPGEGSPTADEGKKGDGADPSPPEGEQLSLF